MHRAIRWGRCWPAAGCLAGLVTSSSMGILPSAVLPLRVRPVSPLIPGFACSNGTTAVCIQNEDALHLQPSWLHLRFVFVVVPSQAGCYFWVTGPTAPAPCRPLAPIGLPVVRVTVRASSDRWRSHPCEHAVWVAETLRGFPA